MSLPVNGNQNPLANAINVSVTPVYTPDDPYGLRTFDITFDGQNGKDIQPKMEVVDTRVLRSPAPP